MPVENDYEDTIVEAATMAGWFVHVERKSRTKDGWITAIKGRAGYFDLTLFHPRRGLIAFIELKRKPNKPTKDQLAWLAAGMAASPDPERVVVAVVYVPEQMTALLDWITDRPGARPPS